jgi:hypothetical protein
MFEMVATASRSLEQQAGAMQAELERQMPCDVDVYLALQGSSEPLSFDEITRKLRKISIYSRKFI